MFIVWRKKILRTERKTKLFFDSGQEAHAGRPKAHASQQPAWRPLWCDHKGEERLAWTPLLMQAERIDGKPRQRLLHRFPTIRSCCIDAPFLRAAWWYAVEEQIRLFEKEDGGIVGRLIARDKKVILAKLREVVPAPSRRAGQEFASYRLHREAAHHSRAKEKDESLNRKDKEQARQEAERRAKAEAEAQAREAQQRAEAERQARDAEQRTEAARRAQEAQQRTEARRQAQEAARRQAEEQARQKQEALRAWDEFVQQRQRDGFGGYNGELDCWGILGIPPYADLDQVQKSYRRLVMEHHPDRGGDLEICKRLNDAHEKARNYWGAQR